jgi:hypothetical protein
MRDWEVCRAYLAADHAQPWLNLHSANTMRDPMTRHTFDRMLATYLGPGWTLKRPRDTCAAGWVRSGLPLEHLRQLLGQGSIDATLPYAQLAVSGTLERDMARLNGPFMHIVQPGGGWSSQPAEADLVA